MGYILPKHRGINQRLHVSLGYSRYHVAADKLGQGGEKREHSALLTVVRRLRRADDRTSHYVRKSLPIRQLRLVCLRTFKCNLLALKDLKLSAMTLGPRPAPPSPTATLTALAAAGRNPTDITLPTVGSQDSERGRREMDVLDLDGPRAIRGVSLPPSCGRCPARSRPPDRPLPSPAGPGRIRPERPHPTSAITPIP